METIYLQPTDETVSLFKNVFSGYSGKMFQIEIHDNPGMHLDSYWSGGSRDYHKIVKLDTMQVLAVPENGSGFVPDVPQEVEKAFPCPGYAVVTHTIFCGKDMGIRIHIHRENARKLVPAPLEISAEEKIVLIATRSLKSSYAGISNYRFQQANEETGITLAQWEQAKAECIRKGYLNKAGAITVAGRNAAGDKSLHDASFRLNGYKGRFGY